MAENNKSKENKKSKLKEMNKRLYTKGFKEEPIEPGRFKKKEYEVSEQWEEAPVEDEPLVEKKKTQSVNKTPMIKKVFLVSVAFFVLALAFVIFTFYRGNNVVSVDSIDLSINGPVSINGGEEFPLEIDIKNNSDVAIESASLLLKYPKGSYETPDSQVELFRKREDLGSIGPGEDFSKKLSLVLFGEENSEKEIVATLELRFKGSSATFEKTESYKIKIASSPVNLSFSVPKETSLKQEFEVVVDLESNSSNTLKDLLLKVDYPFGFTFSGATPAPATGENVWDIGDLAAADKRTIIIRGTLDGQEGDEKVFNASVGTKNKDNNNTIGTIYNFVSESVAVTKPFLGINMLINGSSAPEYFTSSEKPARVDISWKSNIPTRIIDGRIEVKLKGDILDKFSVLAGNGGFYNSANNTIVWDKSNNESLSIIEPGENNSLNFTFQSLPLVNSNGNVYKNPQISIEVSAKGKRISDANVPEEITTSVAKKVKIESDLNIAPRVVYYTGPFKNSGPLPPVAEQKTTYTVIWTVTNSSNNISGAVARTTLPSYVKWLGVVSPTNEDVSFNEVGGEVVWNIGNIERGVGVLSSPREVAFQISFLPSVSQVGKTPFLTGETTMTGEDTFTKTNIKDITNGLSTRLSTDPYFNIRQATVAY
jgi:hypothetical protein